jgi:O-antigen ligase
MQIKIPFLTSSLKSDIIWLWLLLPLWYIVGIDKIIWFPFAFFITVKILILKINRKSLYIPNQIFFKALLLFFLVYSASTILIFFNKNYFLYIKTLIFYYTGFIFILSIVNFKKREETVKLIKIFCFIGIISVIINLLAITGIFRYDFNGLASYFIPSKLLKSQFIYSNLHKTPMDESDKFYSIINLIFTRPKSLFTTPNFFAGFLLISIYSLLYFFLLTKNKLYKYLLISLSIVTLISLFSTLSRSALLGFLLSLLLLFYNLNIRYLIKLPVLLAAVALTFIFYYLSGIYEAMLVRFEGGSVESRWSIYKISFYNVLEYPFFGHGTPLSAPEFLKKFDLGSHSTIINIAFSQGLIGLILYFVMIGYIFFSLKGVLRLNLLREDRILMEMLLYAFIAVSIHCLFITWHYGSIYFMAIWTLWGIILKNTSAMKREYNYVR